jgi:hypothetical protein
MGGAACRSQRYAVERCSVVELAPLERNVEREVTVGNVADPL